MADFKKSYAVTREFEGEYGILAHDSGGETYKGIARNYFPDWEGWPIIDSYKKHTDFPASMRDDQSLQNAVLDLYKKKFWDKLRLDDVNNQAIATELFDTAVNAGVGTSATFLQRAINVSNRNGKNYADIQVDGQVGPTTIDRLNNHKDQALILKLLNILQGAKYVAICENNPTQENFLYGWMKRVAI